MVPPRMSETETARRLVRAADRAALATLMEGAPYASLVLSACDQRGAPLLLISRLAQHTMNIDRDPRVSLLFDATQGLDDPLTGARVSLQGRAHRIEDKALLARYVARHPSAEAYVGFADFGLFRVAPDRAHLVAGFGRIHWIEDVLGEAAPALEAAEPEILAHMNADHAEAVELFARNLCGKEGTGWRLSGIDPEGADLRAGGSIARLDFDTRVVDAAMARKELVRLAKVARGER
jgi:putative heme iron utilization protein